MDDSPPTLITTLGSLWTSIRPDRALSRTPIDIPRELFKTECVSYYVLCLANIWVRPNEEAITLLPLYDLLHSNVIFRKMLLDSLSAGSREPAARPLLPVLLSLMSYLHTHASSCASPRGLAYADLSLNLASGMTEHDAIMKVMCDSANNSVRLCRQVSCGSNVSCECLILPADFTMYMQRLPPLPALSSSSPLVCALLDCLILWLRRT